MAKAKQTRRMVAMALAAAVTMSSVPVVAFAEEVPASETSAPASDTTTSTEKTETPTSDGGTQITETTTTTTGTANAETGETGDNGSVEIKSEVTIKDADGNVVENYTVTEGESTETTVTPDNGNESGQPPVTVPLTPGETTTGEAITDTDIVGDQPTGEDDLEYDYTQTDEIDRTVTAETSGTKVEITETEAELESVKPVYGPTSTDELYSDTGHFGFKDANIWKAIMNELVKMKNNGDITAEEYDALVKSSDGSDYVDGTITYNPDGSVQDAKKNDSNNFYDMMEDPIMLKAIQKVLGDELAANAPDADYVYVGSGHYSGQWVSHITVTYAKDKDTNEPLKDVNGNYIIESVKNHRGEDITVSSVPVEGVSKEYLESLGDIGDAKTLSAVPFTALMPEYVKSLGGDLSGVYDQKTGTRAQQFLLMDKNGNTVFGHCIDLDTGADSGKWYKIANLEDNDYYASQEAEDHVRSIVMNGYWGTSDVIKEDGTYETGSLSKVKKDLLAAIANKDISDTVTVSYRQDGQIVTEEIKVTEELLAGFTPGEALDVMQAAIWSYANGAPGFQDGKDGAIVGGAYLGDTLSGTTGSIKHNEKINDVAGMARMKLFYDWLVGLETEEESTTVINEKNFGEASLTIGDKISSSEDGTKDTYQASLSFKAEFEVGENDELYVNLEYKDLEGNKQVVRKQLGAAGAEATDTMIVPNADNSYTLTDLALTENEEFTFDLRLEGVQQLKQNAYIFVAEGGVGDSQTFVGMAEGTNTVDISTSVTVKFDVDEDDVVRKVRKWRDDGRIKFENDDDDPNPPTPTPEDPTEDPEDPGMTIEDEDVPLADAPVEDEGIVLGAEDEVEEPMVLGAEEEAPLIAATGDSNHMAAGFGGMFAALAGMFFLRKKKED